MKNILALDAATKTGFAHTDGTSGVHELPKSERCCKFAAFSFWLNCLLDEHPADTIVYEQAHHQGGPATRFLVGLAAIIELIAAQRDMEVQTVHTGTLKKHATGKGNAKKFEMRAAAEALGPTVEIVDDNHCDALWLLHWAQTI